MCRGRRPRSSSSASRSPRRARRSSSPTRTTRTTRPGRRSPALTSPTSRSIPATAGRPTSLQAPTENVAAVYLNYPSNPAAVAVAGGAFEEAVAYAQTTGAAIVHDFAYGDLVFDGREPKSFLATPGAKEVGVELFSMSKSYGMAGWRVGFVVGNAEIVERINLLNDHCRVGIFRPIQEACIAALTGPQDSVAERRDTYQRRRDRVREVLEPLLGRSPARAPSTSGSSCPRA